MNLFLLLLPTLLVAAKYVFSHARANAPTAPAECCV